MSHKISQRQINIIRQPARDACDPLLLRIKGVLFEKGAITSDLYSKKLRQELVTLNRIRGQIATMDNNWIAEINESMPVEEYRAEYEQMSRYARKVDEGQALIEDELAELRSEKTNASGKDIVDELTVLFNKTFSSKTMCEDNTTLEGGRTSASDSNLEDVLNRLTVVQEQQSHHLPVLDIKKFNGDITTFFAWWDEFKTNIHERKHMNDTQKFSNLRNLLEEDVAKSIEGTPSSGANYAGALNYLFSRYGNMETITCS